MTTMATQETFDNLATMILYMNAQCGKINNLVGEIAEIQKAFETRLVDSQQKFENAKAKVTVWVEQHGWQQPQWLAAAVAERVPEMDREKRKRLLELAKEREELETQRTEIETTNVNTVDGLKEQNPRLNDREEELKRTQDETQRALQERLEQWRAAGRGLGWLLQPGKVRKLRNEAQAQAQRLHEVNARLTEVRNTWHTMESGAQNQETNLQQAWRLRTAEIARLKREEHSLQTDFEGAVREAALDQVLDAVAEVKPSDQPEFDELLKPLVALHDQTVDYQNGIAQVAELMGIMKGVCEGLTRMQESVKSVKQEQDMHAELKDLVLRAPDAALQFHQLWDKLLPVVLDEKLAAEHPRDLAYRLRETIGDRLSNTAIDAMFNALGGELDRATKEQW